MQKKVYHLPNGVEFYMEDINICANLYTVPMDGSMFATFGKDVTGRSLTKDEIRFINKYWYNALKSYYLKRFSFGGSFLTAFFTIFFGKA